MSTRPRILVAGATGYLGNHAARAFANRGYRVRALSRRPDPRFPAGRVADVFVGDVTRPETLRGACDGVDIIFSALTARGPGVRFRDVDYQGNLNLLEEATRAGVGRFVYVSMFQGRRFRDLEVVGAHEDLVDCLRGSGLDHLVVRPTGFFSDLKELLVMARRGRVFLFGDGRARLNPIDGRDLAVFCAEHIEGERGERSIGGPEVLSYREIAEKAFAAIGRKTVRTGFVPERLARLAVRGVRLVSPHQADIMEFVSTITRFDLVAPPTGHRTISAYFAQQVAAGRV